MYSQKTNNKFPGLIFCFTNATADVHIIDLCMMEDVCYLAQSEKKHKPLV